MVRRGDMMSVEDVTEILAVDLVGVVPDDEQVVIATNQGEILSREQGLAGAAYDNICHRICGEEIPIPDYTKSEGILARMSHLFKRN